MFQYWRGACHVPRHVLAVRVQSTGTGSVQAVTLYAEVITRQRRGCVKLIFPLVFLAWRNSTRWITLHSKTSRLEDYVHHYYVLPLDILLMFTMRPKGDACLFWCEKFSSQKWKMDNVNSQLKHAWIDMGSVCICQRCIALQLVLYRVAHFSFVSLFWIFFCDPSNEFYSARSNRMAREDLQWLLSCTTAHLASAVGGLVVLWLQLSHLIVIMSVMCVDIRKVSPSILFYFFQTLTWICSGSHCLSDCDQRWCFFFLFFFRGMVVFCEIKSFQSGQRARSVSIWLYCLWLCSRAKHVWNRNTGYTLSPYFYDSGNDN